jgi:hypothetical protein
VTADLPGRVLHLTHAENWPAIRVQGLLTARTLVERCVADQGGRDQYLARPRPVGLPPLHHPDLGTVLLRDQGKLKAGLLAELLDKPWTVEDWCRHLNDHVFFFPGRTKPFEALRSAYAAGPQVLLELDTRSLLAEYDSLVKVATLNTGATGRGKGMRGPGTFVSARRYAGSSSRIQEVAVRADVGDLRDHLRAAWLLNPDGAQVPLPLDADTSG